MVLSNAERQKRFRERRRTQAQVNQNELVSRLQELFSNESSYWNERQRFEDYDEEAFLKNLFQRKLIRPETEIKIAKLLYEMLTGMENISDELKKECWPDYLARGGAP